MSRVAAILKHEKEKEEGKVKVMRGPCSSPTLSHTKTCEV